MKKILANGFKFFVFPASITLGAVSPALATDWGAVCSSIATAECTYNFNPNMYANFSECWQDVYTECMLENTGDGGLQACFVVNGQLQCI